MGQSKEKQKPIAPDLIPLDSSYLIIDNVLSHYYTDFYPSTDTVEMLEMDSTGLPHDSIIRDIMFKMDDASPFRFVYNYEVRKFLRLYYLKRRSLLERVMAKATYYFPLFEEELDKRNLPKELKYLAIIESALNPNAISRAGAAGLWQFMPRTGANYGLRINSYFDQRQDPLLATIAACEHLEDLYAIYDDWTLALAAYNSGTGNVNKAIRYSDGKTNYWQIMSYLPSETRGYVPAFIAVAHLIENNQFYGIVPNTYPKSWFDTDTIVLRKKIHFDHISNLLQLEKDEIRFYNPSIKKDLIPADSAHPFILRLPKEYSYTLLINKDSVDRYVALDFKFKNDKEQINLEKQQVAYRVRSGDNLGRIANKYHCRVSDLKRWNKLRSDRIYAGQKLIVYSQIPVKKKTSKKVATNLVYKGEKKNAKFYVVKKGDTLWEIANKYPGLSIDKLKAMNKIDNENRLKLGQKLVIGYINPSST